MKYIMLRKSKFYFIFDASSDAQVKENSRAFPYYSHFRPIVFNLEKIKSCTSMSSKTELFGIYFQSKMATIKEFTQS